MTNPCEVIRIGAVLLPSTTPRDVFLDLVTKVADGRWDALPELYAEATNVEHPFHPLGAAPLRTRDELREHFTPDPGMPPVRRTPEKIIVHETTDPEVVIGEFEYRGSLVGSDDPFAYRCIFVLRVRNGEIVESRDYIDHLGAARARGQLDALIEAVRAREVVPTD